MEGSEPLMMKYAYITPVLKKASLDSADQKSFMCMSNLCLP